LRFPLHPRQNRPEDVKIQERNMFKIQSTLPMPCWLKESQGKMLRNLKEEIKEFILIMVEDPASSDNPEKAIVSFKTDRGTSHKRFIQFLDIIQGAYYDIYAEQAGVTNEVFRNAASDLSIRENKAIYDKGREGIPLNISIADPTKVGN
jgi:hypothetical protein